MAAMPPAGENTVRLVVQRVPGTGSGSYRVIVYPERAGLGRPLTIASRRELVQRLSAALPGFDEARLRAEDGSTQIVFAETLELSDPQLQKLFGA